MGASELAKSFARYSITILGKVVKYELEECTGSRVIKKFCWGGAGVE